LQWSPSSCPGARLGCSLLLLAAHASRRASVLLARVLAVFTGLTVLFVVSGEILALRTPYLSVHRYARALLDGPWNSFFWAELGLLFLAGIVSLAMAWRKKVSIIVAAATALLLCAAVFLERFLVLVPGRRTVWGCPGQPARITRRRSNGQCWSG